MASSEDTAESEPEATRSVGPPKTLSETLGSSALLPGTKVGRFVVVSELGHGGMGSVYAAFDPDLNRKVALKLLHAKVANKGSEATLRLQREAQALARISHPNVVSVHDVGIHNGAVFIAMEFIEGITLRDWVKDKPLQQVLDAFCDAGAGLSAIHAAGMVHRDFKASNVVVSHEGRVKLLDLGLARLSGEIVPHTPVSESDSSQSEEDSHAGSGSLEHPLTVVGQVTGTTGYIAPELLMGATPVASSDQFSFGVALYKALFDELPFRARSIDAYAAALRKGPPRAPPDKSKVPKWLFEVVRRTLDAAPEKRFASMEELLRALRSDPTQIRRRRIAYVLAAVTLSAAIYAGYEKTNPPCATATQTLESLWPLGKFQQLEEKLSAGQPGLHPVVRRGLNLLDQRIREWAQVREDVCRADHPRFSAATVSRRSTCLSLKEQEFRVLLDTLDRSDVLIASKSAHLVRMSVTDPGCQFGVERPQPDEVPAEHTALARELRTQLLRATALDIVGKHIDSKALALQVAQQAHQAKLSGFEGEALYRTGLAEYRLSEYDPAKEHFLGAVYPLVSARVDHLALKSLSESVELFLRKEGGLEQAKQQLRFAEALFERLGSPPDLDLELLDPRVRIARAEARTEDLIAIGERGTRVAKKYFGEYSPESLRAWIFYEMALWGAKRLPQSVKASEMTVRISEVVWGKEDPRTIRLSSDLAAGYGNVGRDDEGLHLLQRTYETAVRVLQPQSPDLADIATDLAYELTQTHPTRALELLSLPMDVYGKGQSPSDLAGTLSIRSRTWVALNRGAEALADCERADRVKEESHITLSDNAAPSSARCRGNALFALGRYKDALSQLSKARAGIATFDSHGSRARLTLEFARARQAVGAPVGEVRQLAEEGLQEIADFPAQSEVKREILSFLETLPRTPVQARPKAP